MSVTAKLYKYYFTKLWRKNWLRVAIFIILIGIVWWFVLPYGAFKLGKATNFLGDTQTQTPNSSSSGQGVKEGFSYRDFSRFLLGEGKEKGSFGGVEVSEIKTDLYREFVRKLRDQCVEFLQTNDKQKLVGIYKKLSPEEKKDLKKWATRLIFGAEVVEKLEFPVVRIALPFTTDFCFFASQTGDYAKFGTFKNWKLLNDIAWWSLSSFTIIYWLIMPMLDSIFFRPRKDGEENSVVSFTPGVTRRDIVWAKILAFLTFYTLVQIFLFSIPFSFYYFWAGNKISFVPYLVLSFYTILVAPLLFFGLILAPYLLFGSISSTLSTLFSLFITLLPTLWYFLKFFLETGWPYTIENWLFDPRWFTLVAIAVGLTSMALYYFKYQTDDLNK